MTNFQRYCVPCVQCGRTTSKTYASAHDGKCKACVTGVEPEPKYKCPQCGGPSTKYKHDHHYVCEACYRENDPEGYRREVMGLNDPPEPDYDDRGW